MLLFTYFFLLLFLGYISATPTPQIPPTTNTPNTNPTTSTTSSTTTQMDCNLAILYDSFFLSHFQTNTEALQEIKQITQSLHTTYQTQLNLGIPVTYVQYINTSSATDTFMFNQPSQRLDQVGQKLVNAIQSNSGPFTNLQTVCYVFLLTGQEYNGILGSSFGVGSGGICSQNGYNSGTITISYQNRKLSEAYVEETLGHEFGHGLSAIHDEQTQCYTPNNNNNNNSGSNSGDTNLMYSQVKVGGKSGVLSECSKEMMRRKLGSVSCLKPKGSFLYWQFDNTVPPN